MRSEARSAQAAVEWVVETPAGEADAVVAVPPVESRGPVLPHFRGAFPGEDSDTADNDPFPLDSPALDEFDEAEEEVAARPRGWRRAANDDAAGEKRIPYPRQRALKPRHKRKPRISVGLRVGLRVVIAAWLGIAGLLAFGYLQKLPPRAASVAAAPVADPAPAPAVAAVAGGTGVPDPLIPFE